MRAATLYMAPFRVGARRVRAGSRPRWGEVLTS